MSDTSLPFDWTRDEYDAFGQIAQVGQHDYHQSELFTRERLIDLLDRYPRRRLQAFTMGEDPCRREDWSAVDIAEHSTGEDLWAAVERGRLWLNVTRIEQNDPDISALIGDMYAHLDTQCPHLGGPQPNFSTLLISSPGAQVYYHLDAEPNILWHLAGNKRIWVYPAMDTRFVPQEYIEDIYAGEVDENLPYDPAFDTDAEEFLLTPGDVASWPHNAPHRIANVDMNISLATSYYTPTIYRRQYTQLANRFLLRGLGVESRSMSEDGLMPALKRVSYRAVNKLRPFERRDRSASYLTDVQVDPNEPTGLRKLDTRRPASFSTAAQGASSH